MRGPSMIPAPSTMPDATFAAVRSSGVFVTAGNREACAGRVSVRVIAASAALAETRPIGASVNSANAAPARATPWRR